MRNKSIVLEQPWQRQQLRVPRADESLFASPPLRDAVEMLRENHLRLQADQTNIQGRMLEHLRRWSREEVLEEARRYTTELNDESIPNHSPELIAVAGHQPALFHAGVWVKNFALGELTTHSDAVGLNLVIDNDTFSTTRIRVPVGSRRNPSVETIPFDSDRPTQPWEDARVLDRGLFESFGQRVADSLAGWNIRPIVSDMWNAAVDQLEKSNRLTDCLTAARNRLERCWGVSNLELPISRLCTLPPFLWFVSHIIAQLPRFHDIHNEVLLQYRQVNRIRSKTHPVANLVERDGWFEAPFRVWREGDLKRDRVFAKQLDRKVELSDGADVFASLPLSPEMDACCAVEALQELSARGIHLRTRALTTTLFARLCLGDLFIHGIGGAKYDEMTDRLIARFYKLNPPSFLTLSATLHLPLEEPYNVEADDETRLQGMLRDLRYNADRHLGAETVSAAQTLIAEKQDLISKQHASRTSGVSQSERRKRSRENFDRYHRLKSINEELSQFAVDQRLQIQNELRTIREQLDANGILKDREFSFCLYPEEKIRSFMSRIWEM